MHPSILIEIHRLASINERLFVQKLGTPIKNESVLNNLEDTIDAAIMNVTTPVSKSSCRLT